MHLPKAVPPFRNQLIQVRTSNDSNCYQFLLNPPSEFGFNPLVTMKQMKFKLHIINTTFSTSMPVSIVTQLEQPRHVQFSRRRVGQYVLLYLFSNRTHPTNIIALNPHKRPLHMYYDCQPKRQGHHNPVPPTNHPILTRVE